MKTAVTAAATQADERLAAHAVAEMPEQIGQLDEAGGEDDRRRQQEREAGRVAVVQAAREAGAHRHAVAADARRPARSTGPRRSRTPRGTRACPARAPPSGFAPSRTASSRTCARRRKRSAREQHQAVDHQEDRRHLGLGGQRAQLVLKHEPEHARGDARDDDQPGQRSLRVSARRVFSVWKKAPTISTQSRR